MLASFNDTLILKFFSTLRTTMGKQFLRWPIKISWLKIMRQSYYKKYCATED